MSVAPSDVLFYAGGRCVELFGTLVWRQSRRQDSAETFNRDSDGYAISPDGTLRAWSSDRARITYPLVSDVREAAYLGEGAATNQLRDSADVDADGSSNWSEVGAWTQATATSVISGQTAQKYTNPNDDTFRSISQTTPVLLATPVVFSVVIENVDALAASIGIRDTTALDWLVRAEYTWATDSIVADAHGVGSSHGVRSTVLREVGPNGGKLVRLEVFATADNPGNTGGAYIYATGQTQNALSAIIHHAQYEDGTFATSPIVTTTTAGTRDDDLLTLPIGFTPADIVAAGGATFYSRMQELGTAFVLGGTTTRYWHIGGGDSGDDPRMGLACPNTEGQIVGFIDIGSGAVVSSITGVSFADLVEACLVIYQDASDDNWYIQLHASLNDGTEVSGTATEIGATLPDAWSADTLTIGAAPDGSAAKAGFAAHFEHIGLRGEKTMAECQGVFR